MTCPHCQAYAYTYYAKCQQCEWRHIARMLKHDRVAWWRQQDEATKEQVREYWLQVKANDEGKHG